MAEVPHDERPGLVGDAGESRGIREISGPVGDVREQHDRGLAPDGRTQRLRRDPADRVDVDPAHATAALRGDAVDEVAVGGEVVAIDHDLDARRVGGDGGIERRPHHLVEQHGRRVADHGLARRRADRGAADGVADVEGQLHPRLVPAADEAPAPLVARERGEPLDARAQRPAEGVAVEVDQRRLGPDEGVAVAAERVGRVEGRDASVSRSAIVRTDAGLTTGSGRVADVRGVPLAPRRHVVRPDPWQRPDRTSAGSVVVMDELLGGDDGRAAQPLGDLRRTPRAAGRARRCTRPGADRRRATGRRGRR